MLELTIRTLCDVRARTVADGVYLFSQTSDNQHSVLSAALEVLHGRLAEKIFIVDSSPKSGYPGYAVWEKELTCRGVPKGRIVGIDLNHRDALNTLIEAEAMVKCVKENQYRDIYIVAAPFHQLRAFMTSVTAAMKYYPRIRIYSYNGVPLNWLNTVVHSQGTTFGLRKELIKEEFERIGRYQRKGDLAHEKDILEYLDGRDQRPS